MLALCTAMRQGELFGLKWSDVDWTANRLQVRRSIARARGGWIEQEPKSAKSRRSVPLIPLAVAALKRHRVRQAEQRLAAGGKWQDHGLVFTNAIGNPLSPQNVLRRSYYPLLESAGLPRITFHDLRHSTASLLLSLGVHPKVVQEFLGHSQIGVTLDTYSHVMPTLGREAMDKLDSLLSE